MINWFEISERALAFSDRWKNCKGDERQEAQTFEKDFMQIFGIDWREGLHEYKVTDSEGKDGFIDYFYPSKIVIEMKSKGTSLAKAYNQAIRYIKCLKVDEYPELLVVSDFEYIQITNLKTMHTYNKFKITSLEKHIRKFIALTSYDSEVTYKSDVKVNLKAAYKMAKLHDELKSKGYKGENLEIYLVRLLFCLFAEDTGIFEFNYFRKYIQVSKEDGSDLSNRLMMLFSILDEPEEKRMINMTDELRHFRYINGSLFSKSLPPAFFDSNMRNLLLECCNFNWSYISPAIFGAMFQGVMDEKQRRTMGAHYTNEDNILKVIKPLFLDDLWEEFNKCKYIEEDLKIFHEKLGQLLFLDPACGCGNFLIITYREIRILEFEVLKILYGNHNRMFLEAIRKVSINQFYGIEYEEFPCQIAKVGMILMKHQIDKEMSNYFGINIVDFPIKQSANIVHGNALRLNWEEVVSKKHLSYIIGNPPFSAGRRMNEEQREDMNQVAKKFNKSGELDYVAAWYIVASQYIQDTNIEVGFVSTSSITQGSQVALLWKPLFEKYDICITYAVKSFKWHNEAKNNAGVHCVIIQFRFRDNFKSKYIVHKEKTIKAKHINGYLVDMNDIWIESSRTPISNVPKIGNGSKPLDNAICAFSTDEKDEFIKNEPNSEKYFFRYMGSKEFINNIERWFLFINRIPPNELKKMPLVISKLDQIREYRLSSNSKQTKLLANTPSKFHYENIPKNSFLVIPQTSSGKRKYIPIGFLTPDILVNNKLQVMQDGGLYEFGILSSSIHNAWLKFIGGRLREDYTYSVSIVYNTFPWPKPTNKQKENIEIKAKNILDIRAKYIDSSLADLYDSSCMPLDLYQAHKDLDKEVCKSYGVKVVENEEEYIDFLIKLYNELV